MTLSTCRHPGPPGDPWASGRDGFPELPVSRARFAGYLAERASEEVTSPGRAADLYLACACLDEVPGAVAAFERELGSEIDRIARTARGGEDVGQVVRQRLFAGGASGKKIARYSGRAPLRHWLRVVTTRVAQNMSRKRSEVPATEALFEALADEAAGPEASLIEATLAHEYRDAFGEAFRALDPAQRQLLYLSVIDELGIDAIASRLQIHRATAARRLASARARLAALSKEKFSASAGLSKNELISATWRVRACKGLELHEVIAFDFCGGSSTGTGS